MNDATKETAMSETTWVVLVSETIEGETTCQVVSEWATEAEANDAATDTAYRFPAWLVEVCTAAEAEAVVTD